MGVYEVMFERLQFFFSKVNILPTGDFYLQSQAVTFSFGVNI